MKLKFKYYLKRLKYNPKRSFVFMFLFLSLVSLTVGYAFLTTTMNIDGVSKMLEARWDIHFDNLEVTTGSVTATTAASIATPTSVTFAAQLENPGDFYEFTVDVVNEGTINAMIDSVNVLPVLTSEQEEYLDYIVTYTNGVELAPRQRLDVNDSERILVRFLYKDGVDESVYPTEDQELTIQFEVVYIQADGTEEDIVCPSVCPAGTYSPADSCDCILCDEGTTSGEGASSCSSCSNAANVSTWVEPELNNNTVSNLCVIDTCVSGYNLTNDNVCRQPYTVTFNYNKATWNTNTTRTCTPGSNGKCSVTAPGISDPPGQNQVRRSYSRYFSIKGWDTNSNATSATYGSTASIEVSGNTTYYAIVTLAQTSFSPTGTTIYVRTGPGTNYSATGMITLGSITVNNYYYNAGALYNENLWLYITSYSGTCESGANTSNPPVCQNGWTSAYYYK